MACSLLMKADELCRLLFVLKAPIEISVAPAHGIVRPAPSRERDRGPTTGFSALVDHAASTERPAPKPAEARPARGLGDTSSLQQGNPTPQSSGIATAEQAPAKTPDATVNSAAGVPLELVAENAPKADDSASSEPAVSLGDVAAATLTSSDVLPDAQVAGAPADNTSLVPPPPVLVAAPVSVPLPITPIAAPAPPPVESTAPASPAIAAITVAATPVETVASRPTAKPNEAPISDQVASAPIELPPGIIAPKITPKEPKTAAVAAKKTDAPNEQRLEVTDSPAELQPVASTETLTTTAPAPAPSLKADETPVATPAKLVNDAPALEPTSRPAAVATAPIPAAPNPSDIAAASVPLPPSQPLVHSAAPISPTAQLTATVASGAPVPLNGLAVEIATRSQSGASSFAIRLDPADLGRIDVRLDVDKHGQVTSHLTVEKPETLAMLRQDAPQLQRALNDSGLKTADNSLQFSLGDQASPQHNADRGGERQSQRFIVQADDTIVAPAQLRGYGRMAGARSGIDIRV